jgi:Bacterial Ig-like domain (group 3)/MBG domain (YGX type)/PQQ enzyme repeat
VAKHLSSGSFLSREFSTLSKRFLALSNFFLLVLGFSSIVAAAQVNVYTRSNDNSRTGANLQETILTPANVNSTNFGKLFTIATDGQIYAQPLYVSNLAIAGGTHNVVFVASMLNTVYALDADTGATLWTQNYGSPIIPQDVEFDQNISWATRLGILGTPVIDPATNYMYFVSGAQPADGTKIFSYNLNAIDITTGLPVNGSPVAITATYSTPDLTTPLVFNPQMQNPRPALALANGNVYVSFASHEDAPPYHGFVLAYSTSTLAQTAVYSDTTIGTLGGIWCAGQAPSVDAAGNLYISTGNGSFGTTPNNLVQTGNSFIKLSPSLQLLDYFTPYNSATMNSGDMDLGSSGLLLIPNTNYVVGGGKQGILYLANTSAMGEFNASSDQVKQEFQAVYGQGTSHIHGGPVYFNSDQNGPTTYLWGENDVLRGFLFNSTTGLLTTTPFATSTMTAPVTNNDGAMPGGFLAVSANGQSNGILWASTPYNANAVVTTVQGVLYAFNADTLNLLWSDKTNDARDEVGSFAKYVPPLVANGKLYMATFGPLGTTDGSGALVVYGLLQAPLTVNVSNATMTAGAALPTFTGTVTGLVNGDTLGTTIIVTYSTTATSTSPAGTYPITATVSGTSANNYFVTVNAGTLVISSTAQTLTVAAGNAARTYGATNPAFTGTVTGAQNGDTFTESFSTTATAASNVGSYPIVPAASGTNLGSYSVVIVDGALTVTPAALTAAANNASRVYGAANPAFSGTVSGAVGSDSFTESFTTAATATSNVGSYPIVPAVSGPQSNYAVTLVNGALTVTAASTATALTAPASAAYGASVTLTATVSSSAGTPGGKVTFTSGSTTLGTGTLNATGAATLSTTALPAGTNTVTAVYAAAGNFAASTSPAASVIVSAPPVTTAGSYSMSASPATLTVKQGAAANTTLTFTPAGGYKDTVSLSYSNLPANVSCAFAQNQVIFTGNNQSSNVVMTLQTGTQSSARQPPSGVPPPTALLALAFWWPGSLTGIALFVRKRKLARKGLSWQVCLLVLCTLACAAGLSACGGGGGSQTPPAASPTTAQVTVIATGSAANAVPQTLVVTLNITQ